MYPRNYIAIILKLLLFFTVPPLPTSWSPLPQVLIPFLLSPVSRRWPALCQASSLPGASSLLRILCFFSHQSLLWYTCVSGLYFCLFVVVVFLFVLVFVCFLLGIFFIYISNVVPSPMLPISPNPSFPHQSTHCHFPILAFPYTGASAFSGPRASHLFDVHQDIL